MSTVGEFDSRYAIARFNALVEFEIKFELMLEEIKYERSKVQGNGVQMAILSHEKKKVETLLFVVRRRLKSLGNQI